LADTFSVFAATVRDQKYAHTKPDGTKEDWSDISFRVAKHVLRAVNAPQSQIKATAKLIEERKFIPGGRYLYASGRPFHQTQNCVLFRAEDSREGWADQMQKVTLALMTGAGIGVVYSDLRPEGKPIRRTGGFSTGPLSLMAMTNEAGRGIMQGGSRRAAIWAGLHWWHADAHKFIHLKDWIPEVRSLKEKDFSFPAQMDMTNISIILDDEFFKAYHNEKHPKHSHAYSVYWDAIRQMRKTGEPGFSIDTGANNKENLRNACQPANARVIGAGGYTTIGSIREGDRIWSCEGWTKVVRKWSEGIKPVYRYRTSGGHFLGTEDHKVFCLGKLVEVKDATHLDSFPSPGTLSSWATDHGHAFYGSHEIYDKHLVGDYEVFHLTVDNESHSYVTGGVMVSNCTEVTSEDDSDICNLGSINLSRIESIDEMKAVVEAATKFLIAGTVYSDVPFAKIDQVRTKNRRLGLGLMGIHEWLLKNGKKYGPDAELEKYLKVYATSGEIANAYADELDISHPKKTRAIAPTGSIGILAETTTGIEPVFCAAYKRRYLKHRTWNYQYVVDPTAAILVERGVDPDTIEDAYSIDEERRVAFQAWVQQYVDHAISSTINLPPWGSESNNDSTVRDFGEMLLKYLPKLRGLTCYPDGARGGQPLTPVRFSTALKHLGQIFTEDGGETLAEAVAMMGNSLDRQDGVEPTALTKATMDQMTDEDAARPLNLCDITGKGGECGS